MKRILLFCLVAIMMASLLLIAGCGGKYAQVGKVAPDFQLLNTDGNTVSIADFRGSPVLINFWGTSCIACREELPYFPQVYNAYKDKGLVMISINTDDTAANVKDYLQRNNLSFPVELLSHGSGVDLTYGARLLPTTLLLNKDGIVLELKVGAYTNEKQIETETLSQVFPDIPK